MIIQELTTIQHEHGYLPAAELQALSRRLNVPLYRLHGVASFYPHFRLQPPPRVYVQVCNDIACFLRGAAGIHDIVQTSAEALGLTDVQIRPTSCLGQCDGAPAIAVNGQYYTDVNAQRITDLLHTAASDRTLRRQRLAPVAYTFQCNPYKGPPTYDTVRRLRQHGDVETVLNELKQSGLRGMGGAGFPTGTKWELVRNTPGDVKYVVCNADESEPGTFKDRIILLHMPELVLEGIALAARVVGATEAIIYLRHEYSRERDTLQKALRQAQVSGFFAGLSVEIFDSPGGYICGEETALLEALEDKRAEPRNKPPFPGAHGLFGKPTLINNVETFAMVPGIVLKGGTWWAAQGKNGASGLKFLAVSGHVRNPGVYEVPLGTTARELIDLAGGLRHGRPLKAFAPGGASSGFLPASMVDTPLDFRSLAAVGSMLGSGAVVAVAEGTCMLELALNVGRFFRNESCGKCVPCRVGSDKIVLLLERMMQGHGSVDDLALIEELSATMALTSICGLGQAAPNPILSVIKYFKDDITRYITR
ncbi:MAG: nitroreductase family protein [Candidatus Tectomicrobia bacterium]|uniref:Nitroreductase family protein n=1 Tax=Tectimicrobiota bacterium TaxID=2528274 RepID=A0A938B4K9_UNCTE|nr:nitroreductase family protein [Candidatus Tectomicrobia bacterium]